MPPAPRLTAVPSCPATRPSPDPRVRAAAAVLAGQPVERVADDSGTDPAQLLRWAEALERGGEAVAGIGLERPADGPVASRVPVEDFLSVVAHEVRTPLTAARSGLRVLASPAVDPAVRERVAATVLQRLAELERLTEDLATAVEVASGRRRPRPERVDLGALASLCCAEAGLAEPLLPPAGPHVAADPALLRTVVSTLLAHAGRYADPADTAVKAQAVAGAALLTVKLTGTTLEPERAEAMFEPFGAAARGDGNGLALYVVRALVVAAGGAVGLAGQDATDDAPGATVLWARLPLHAPDPR